MMPASAIHVKKAPTVTPTRLPEITCVPAQQDTLEHPAIKTSTNAHLVKVATSKQQISLPDQNIV